MPTARPRTTQWPANPGPRGVPVTLIDVAELLVWFCVVSAAAAALADRISRASFRRRMEQVSGLVFLGFAVSLAADRT